MLATRHASLLAQHVEANHLGAVMTTAGVKLASDPDTVREPDVAFVRQQRSPDSGVPDGYWPGAPDLAVEIRSPGDRRSEIAAKVDDYLARGVPLVWVVDPKTQTETVHRPRSAAVTLGIDEVLDGGDVLPGFIRAVRLIFE